MSLLQRTFRSWWQIPRQVRDRIDHRTVSFLELFYDLVYVVLIAEVAHALAGHTDLAGLGRFVFLFLIVWWAWLNGTIYHDLHGNNDIRTRLFTFLQMIFVAAMAVFAHDAMGESSAGFALSYAGFQLLFAYLWWRTGVHDPAHRPLSQPYVATFLISALLFVLSVWAPSPLGFYLWGVSLISSLLLPFVTLLRGRTDPAVQAQIDQASVISPSAVERFDLFTIIVLGEVIAGVIRGLQSVHRLDWVVGGTALLGMLVAIGIWWVYFDLISHNAPKQGRGWSMAWLYLHLPLTISITAVGAAVLNVTQHAGEHLAGEVRWLLVGSVAVAFVSVVLLLQTIQSSQEHRQIHRVGGIVLSVSTILIGLLGLTTLEAIGLLLALILLMLSPILVGLWVWVKMLEIDSGGGEDTPSTT